MVANPIKYKRLLVRVYLDRSCLETDMDTLGCRDGGESFVDSLSSYLKNRSRNNMNNETPKHYKSVSAIFITSLIFFWILWGFSVGVVLAIILGIISYKLFQKKPQYEKYSKGIAVFLVIFSLVGIFAPAAKQDAEMRQENEEVASGQSETHNYVTEEGTYERSVELAVLGELGVKTIIEGIRVENGELNIEYVASENLSTNLTVRGIMNDAEDLMQKLSANIPAEVNTVNFSSSLNLVDQYGNTELAKVALIAFDRSTWEQINWDNFITDNIPTVADYYWLHPALQN